MIRACSTCGIEKPLTLEFFYAQSSKRSGLRTDCKECVKSRTKRWSDINPGRRTQISREWRHKNPEKAKAKRRRYCEKNRNTVRAGIARWQAKNPERQKAASARYWKRHRERLLGESAAWKAANPDKCRVQWRTRRARKRGAIGHHTAEDAATIRKHQHNRCAYCRDALGRSAHLDHIISLSRGGSNWPSNLQWLCAPCNLSKNARDPIDYAQSRGLLL